MKKIILSATLVVAAFSFTSCGIPTTTTDANGNTTVGTTSTGDILSTILGGTTGTTGSTGTDAAASILGNLLGGLLSNTITEQSFVGTWTYQAPEVRFESESLLAQAGGSVVASSIENKLASYLTKVGITKGVTSFTFNADKTYTIATNGQAISAGTYTYDKSTKTLKMQSTLGLLNQNCTVGMDGTNLCLLYDADKLLSLMNSAGSILGQASSTLGSITSVLGQNYNGMKVGFSLSK